MMITIYNVKAFHSMAWSFEALKNEILSLQVKQLILTTELNGLITFPPCIDSGFEWAIGLTGKEDDAVFIFDVNSFVRDNVLKIGRFSHIPAGESPSCITAAFSMSKVLLWHLKLSFGRRVFMVSFFFDDEGPGEQLTFADLGLGNGEKFTLLGVRLGVWGMLILK